MTSNPFASVIIPTRNRADTLIECLASLTLQTISPSKYEVIVVDNGSNDNTKEVVLSFSKNLQVLYRYEPEPGLHIGRHVGMRLAKSDILIYADDDIIATPTWIESIIKNFNFQDIVMVGGNNYPEFENTPPLWLSKLWHRQVYLGKALGYLSILDFGDGRYEFNPCYVWGCNFSIRRKILLKAGGFHPDALPKDRIFYRGDGETYVAKYIRDRKMKAIFDSKASVYHKVSKNRMTIDYFAHRAFAQGISDSYTLLRKSNNSIINKRLRKFLIMIRDNVQEIFQILEHHNEQFLYEQRFLLKLLRKSYWKGYSLHQAEYKNNPHLMEWVKKENYL